jgi:hypothetical protein
MNNQNNFNYYINGFSGQGVIKPTNAMPFQKWRVDKPSLARHATYDN